MQQLQKRSGWTTVVEAMGNPSLGSLGYLSMAWLEGRWTFSLRVTRGEDWGTSTNVTHLLPLLRGAASVVYPAVQEKMCYKKPVVGLVSS